MKTMKQQNEWRELFKHAGKRSTFYLFQNQVSGEVDLVQVNSEGESITTNLSRDLARTMIASLEKSKV